MNMEDAANDGAPVPEFKGFSDDEEGESDEEFEPFAVSNPRGKLSKIEYYVHGKGFPESEATWEPNSHIASCTAVARAWEDSKVNETATNQSSKRGRRRWQ